MVSNELCKLQECYHYHEVSMKIAGAILNAIRNEVYIPVTFAFDACDAVIVRRIVKEMGFKASIKKPNEERINVTITF